MKIKHWQGYGFVNARKISKDENTLVVEVRGEHEYGLERDDTYDVFNWLVTKFDKSRKSWLEIKGIEIKDDYVKKEGNYTGYEEVCTYTIRF